MPRMCPFCGRRATTDEHVIPQWVSMQAIIGDAVMHDPGDGMAPWRNKRIELIARVCDRCQPVWMNPIEDATRPILRPMLQRQPWAYVENGWPPEEAAVLIPQHDQAVLAAWSAKVAMAAEFTMRDYQAKVPQVQRDYISQTGEAPPSCWVWIGALRERLPMTMRVVPVLFPGFDDPPEPDVPGFVVTFSVAAVIFQVIFHLFDSVERLPFPFFRPRADPFLLRIWPPSPIDLLWPPAKQIATVDELRDLGSP